MYSALHDRAPAAPGSCSATSPGPRMRPSGREAWTRVPASPRLVPRWGRRTRAGRPGKSVSAPPGPGSIYRLPAAAQWASRAAHSGSLRSPAEGRHVPTDAPNPQPRGASAADWEAAAAWKPRAPSCFLPWPGRGGWRQVWSPPRPPGWAARGASAHPPPSAPSLAGLSAHFTGGKPRRCPDRATRAVPTAGSPLGYCWPAAAPC